MSTLKTNNIQHVDRSDPSIIISTDGGVSIAGTLTYEDVTSVDAVGIVTAREILNAQKQVHVGTGVSVKAGGINVTAGITTVQALQATTGNFSSNVDVAGEFTVAETIAHTGDTNNKISFPAADTITLTTAGSERLRIDSSGRLLHKHTASRNVGTKTGQLQVINTGNDATISIIQTNNAGSAPFLCFGKTRSANTTGSTIVQDGDSLGQILFCGADGTDVDSIGAWILAQVDGTPGSNDMPGRLIFSTSADGSASPTERLRIHSNGIVTLGNDAAGAASYGGQMVIATTTGGVLTCADTGSGERLRLEGGSGLGRIGTVSNHDLVFITNGTSNERLRITTSGQVGLSVTPDTWSTGHGLTIGTSQATLWGTGDQINLSGNAYFNSGWKAAATKAGASQIQQSLGQIDFRVSGSVTADAAITFIDALRIASDGTLTKYYNSTSPQFYLGGTSQVNGIAAIGGANSAPLVIGRDSGNAKSIHCSGNIQMASGYGIDFSPTGEGSNTSSQGELFDDYEEGTVNILIHDAAGSNISVQTNTFKYTKIGNKVFIAGSFVFAETGSKNGGLMVLYNLPFVPVQNLQATGTYWYDATSDAGDVTGVVYVNTNSVAYLKQSTTIGQNSNYKYLTFNEIQKNSTRPLHAAFSYITNS